MNKWTSFFRLNWLSYAPGAETTETGAVAPPRNPVLQMLCQWWLWSLMLMLRIEMHHAGMKTESSLSGKCGRGHLNMEIKWMLRECSALMLSIWLPIPFCLWLCKFASLFQIFTSQAKQVTPWSSQGGNTSKNKSGAGFQVFTNVLRCSKLTLTIPLCCLVPRQPS